MQRLVRLLSALLLAALGLLAAGASSAAEAKFPTPEDAVTAYIEGVAAQDFKAVYAATAVDEMSKGFDFVAFIDRLQVLTPQMAPPATDPFFVAINRAQYTAQIARQLQFFAYGLMSPVPDLLDNRTARMDAAGAEGFVLAVDAGRLGGIALVRIGAPNPTILNSERHRANAAKIAAYHGADDATDRIALFTFEGKHYAVGFSLLRYGAEWKISSQSSPIAGTDAFGTPKPTTPEEFEAALQ